MEIIDNSTTITLHQAAALASQVTEVVLYYTCKQATACHTKRCKCFKSGAKCTNYCPQPNEEPEACPNLALPEDRNTRILVSRTLPPLPTSESSHKPPPPSPAIIQSDSDSQTTQNRKRRASCLSTTEKPSLLRYTRSKQTPIESPLSSLTSDHSPSTTLENETLDEPSDTIVVRQS